MLAHGFANRYQFSPTGPRRRIRSLGPQALANAHFLLRIGEAWSRDVRSFYEKCLHLENRSEWLSSPRFQGESKDARSDFFSHVASRPACCDRERINTEQSMLGNEAARLRFNPSTPGAYCTSTGDDGAVAVVVVIVVVLRVHLLVGEKARRV